LKTFVKLENFEIRVLVQFLVKNGDFFGVILQKINKFNTSHGEMGYLIIFYSIRVLVEGHNSEKTINFVLAILFKKME